MTTDDETDTSSLPSATFEARLAAIRDDIGRQGLAGVLVFEPDNIFWLTGYQTLGYFTFQCLFVPASGAPVLVSRVLNRRLARECPAIGRFVAINDTDSPVAVLAGFLDGRVAADGVVGIETAAWYLTVDDFAALSTATARRLAPWRGVVESRRAIKSPAEIGLMRRAARAAEAGLAAAIARLAPGVGENEVAGAMIEATLAAGSDYLGHPPIVTSGPRSALCFATWSRRALADGDVVFLENGGCIDRYHAMLARTAVLGAPPREVERLAAGAAAVLERAIAAIRPGVTSAAVDAAARDEAARRGLDKLLVHRTAYGVGIGFPPNWSEGRILGLKPDDPTVLQPGMAFHIAGASLFVEDFGLMISDTVIVSDTGCEVLTDYPRGLIRIDA